MIDLIEMYVHWYAGRSQAQIADSLGMDRKTIRKYLAPVAAAGLVPGGPPAMTEADWRDRAAVWFPALVDKGLRQVTWPAIGAHRDYITAQLQAGVTVATIHQARQHRQVVAVGSLARTVLLVDPDSQHAEGLADALSQFGVELLTLPRRRRGADGPRRLLPGSRHPRPRRAHPRRHHLHPSPERAWR